MSAGLYKLSDLDPAYRFLPLVAHVEGEKKRGNVTVTYFKTYPPFPWKSSTGDHFEEDPITFIDLCADAGLVKWENAAERDARIEAEMKKEEEEKKRKREQ